MLKAFKTFENIYSLEEYEGIPHLGNKFKIIGYKLLIGLPFIPVGNET